MKNTILHEIFCKSLFRTSFNMMHLPDHKNQGTNYGGITKSDFRILQSLTFSKYDLQNHLHLPYFTTDREVGILIS